MVLKLKLTLTLSFKDAMEIASAALTKLEEDGKEANICVVNKYGRPLVRLYMDNTRRATANIALKKAKLSSKTGYRTGYLQSAFDNHENGLSPSLLGIKEKNLVPYAGGVPIYVESEGEKYLIGGMGISNLSEKEDEKYAIVAVETSDKFSSDRK